MSTLLIYAVLYVFVYIFCIIYVAHNLPNSFSNTVTLCYHPPRHCAAVAMSLLLSCTTFEQSTLWRCTCALRVSAPFSSLLWNFFNSSSCLFLFIFDKVFLSYYSVYFSAVFKINNLNILYTFFIYLNILQMP